MAKGKPVLTAQGLKGDRQAMWEAIRHFHTQGQAFCIHDIWEQIAIGVSHNRVRDYFTGLRKAGFIECDSSPKGGSRYYKLIKDVGVEAPRVRRDGTTPPPQGREQMWRTLKIIGECTAAELAQAATTPEVPVSHETTIEYLRLLTYAGYVTITRPATSGTGAVNARYRLNVSRWTGPMAPMIRRTKELYDPNTGEVVYSRVTKTEGGEP
ncbi:Phage protein [Halomonas citrativorans]|uniref:Phage protein n=1 Tax=Halomonas citrativorans TaxID=2742612 RepID=A0A1R4HP80_9GAMM|nr:hypothetical protein [Halomonas citrativorans]SJN08993.1 Phage protein [Halomonas citrativorans]